MRYIQCLRHCLFPALLAASLKEHDVRQQIFMSFHQHPCKALALWEEMLENGISELYIEENGNKQEKIITMQILDK